MRRVTRAVTPLARVTTVEEALSLYYKPERLHREPGTRDRIADDRRRDLARYGRTILASHHDSVMGCTVWIVDRVGGLLVERMDDVPDRSTS